MLTGCINNCSIVKLYNKVLINTNVCTSNDKTPRGFFKICFSLYRHLREMLNVHLKIISKYVEPLIQSMRPNQFALFFVLKRAHCAPSNFNDYNENICCV